MRRKAILNLLLSKDREDELRRLLPDDDKATEQARLVMLAILKKFQDEEQPDPARFLSLVYGLDDDRLCEYLVGTAAGGLSEAAVAGARAIVSTLLSGKPGSKKRSGTSRAEQLVAASARRRRKLAEEGRVQIGDWISASALSYLRAVQTLHGCASRGDALEMVLQAAIQKKILL